MQCIDRRRDDPPKVGRHRHKRDMIPSLQHLASPLPSLPVRYVLPKLPYPLCRVLEVPVRLRPAYQTDRDRRLRESLHGDRGREGPAEPMSEVTRLERNVQRDFRLLGERCIGRGAIAGSAISSELGSGFDRCRVGRTACRDDVWRWWTCEERAGRFEEDDGCDRGWSWRGRGGRGGGRRGEAGESSEETDDDDGPFRPADRRSAELQRSILT